MLVLLLALDNLPGIDVTALLASLGVGGILELMRWLAAAGTEFAFPTRTLYLANGGQRRFQRKAMAGANSA